MSSSFTRTALAFSSAALLLAAACDTPPEAIEEARELIKPGSGRSEPMPAPDAERAPPPRQGRDAGAPLPPPRDAGRPIPKPEPACSRVEVPPPPPNVEVRECPPKGTACAPGLPLWCTLDKRLAIFTCEGGADRPSYLRPLAIEGDVKCEEPAPSRPVPPQPEPACSRAQVPPPPPNVEVRECPPKGTACAPGLPLWCTLDKRLAIFTCQAEKGAPGVLVPLAIEGEVKCEEPAAPRPARDCAAACEAKLRPVIEGCLARAKEPRDRGVCGDPAFQSVIARCLEACGDGACAGAEGTGTYEGAMCGTGGGIRTKEIACRDAHANCLVNAWANGGSDMSCRWNDRGLRKGSCAPVVQAPPRK